MVSVRWNRLLQPLQRRKACLCLVILILFAGLSESLSKERLNRMLSRSSGLPSESLSGYAQDTNGFFWISSAVGVFRYDGTEFRRWAPEKLTGSYYMVYPAPDGEVYVYDSTGTLYHLLPNEDAEPVIGPDNKPFTGVRDVAFTSNKAFWVAGRDALFRRNERNEWVEVLQETSVTEKIWKLRPTPDGSLYAVTAQSIWKIGSDLSYHLILRRKPGGNICSVIEHPDGSLFFMEKYGPDHGKIFRFYNGQVKELIALNANLQRLALRGRTVWGNTDKHLVVLREGADPEVLRVPLDIPGSGFPVVDNENSLWIGSWPGLMQIPEPDTVIFNEKDGLPNGGVRYLKESKDGVWAVAWFGTSFIESKNQDWRVHSLATNPSWLDIDGNGTLWGHNDDDSFVRRVNGKFIKLPTPAAGNINDSSRAHDGRLWIASDKGLWRTPAYKEEGIPQFLGNPLGEGVAIDSVLEDSKGRLWLTKGDAICYVSAALIASGKKDQCSPQTLTGSRGLRKLIELPNGTLWVGTTNKGVWRHTDEEGWKPIPASLKQPSLLMGGFARSPSGGIWVFGLSTRIRVLDRPDLSDGWEVVEEMSEWQGVPIALNDLLEEPDGSLWIASQNGLIHMPAEVRHPHIAAPRVKLVGLIMNGARVDLNSTPEIPPGHNQLEIHFAALSFRDRSLLKYQYRLHPNDAWTDSASNVPVFRFFDLRPGEYAAEVRASLDGVNWSGETASIVFVVLPPWYMRWWSITIGLLLLGLTLYATHRTRLALVLRLERQRARIARDLHDEIGSGLGSIGILSSVAASQTIGEDQRQEMTKRIAETAHELGTSLTDIVWSLRSETTTLESLAYYLARRADTLFANDQTHFITNFPVDWPTVNLSLTTRRNVFLIAMECLHNAVKHAQAGNVTLQFQQSNIHLWLMQVEDDGCGMPDYASNNSPGMGMNSMKYRAEEMGAELNISSNNGRGTVVTLAFDPATKKRSAA
jgi:signal transduction histidine kinase/ligand-binding sensor domain-containing protein